MTLTQAYKIWGATGKTRWSDKGLPYHSYIDWYETRLAPIQDTAEHVLEFGTMYLAKSIYLWREYFTKAVIWGMDIGDIKILQLDRTVFMHCDCTKPPPSWVPVFDLIVDDASHVFENQVKAYEQWFNKLGKNGLYVIEDILTVESFNWFLDHGFEGKDFSLTSGIYADRLVWKKRL